VVRASRIPKSLESEENMASKRKPTTPSEPGPRQVSSEQGLHLLEQLKEKGERLLNSRPLSPDDHSQWKLLARNYLEKVFGANSPNITAITNVGVYGSFPINASEDWWEGHRAESLATQLTRLDGLLELLATEVQLASGKAVAPPSEPHGHRIFLVHGHDEAALHAAARFLDKLNLEYTVLREEPNRGRTIIEKFEDYADVGFAVVLLTSDDRGGPVDAPYESQHPRARQHVILELGYFLGRLGRARVCVLYSPGVEVPSDYSGVIYVELDSRGAWYLELARELKAAEFPIDMNLAV
jgi:predicted nucleotide-binding protein